MAGLPVYFRSGGDYTVNYNFTELASGSGIITLYAGKDQSAGILSVSPFYSDKIATNSTTLGTTYAKEIDMDFDLSINKPITLKGNAFFSVPITFTHGTGNHYAYCIVKVRKWDGSTETDIASGTSTTWKGAYAHSAEIRAVRLVKVNVPLTLFKKGETLRITVEVWAKSDQSPRQVFLGHDPMGRIFWDGSTEFTDWPTQLKCNIPLRIDI